MKYRPLAERLADMTQPEPNSGCWLFTGRIDRDGYGVIRTDGGGTTSAHRAAWSHHQGAVPPGLCVCHICDVRSCVNPDHLFLGTHAENMRDMATKGRGIPPPMFGTANGQSRLDDDAVATIRATSGPRKALAAMYGVSTTTIGEVRSGRSWRQRPRIVPAPERAP